MFGNEPQRGRSILRIVRDDEPRTQSELDSVDDRPPRWPNLPHLVASATEEPSRRTVLRLETPPECASILDIRGMTSTLLGILRLQTLSERVALKNYLCVKGPLNVPAGDNIELSWQVGHEDSFSMNCTNRYDLNIREGETAILMQLSDKVVRLRNKTKAREIKNLIPSRRLEDWEVV